MKKHRVIAGIIAVVLLLITAAPVYAFLSNPTDDMTIEDVRVFRNVATSGDIAIIYHYKIPYDDYPETQASNSIIFRLKDTDDTTVLMTTVPYVYTPLGTNGYGDGVSYFYSDNDTLTWGADYVVEIAGLPIYYSPPLADDYTLSTADWSTATSQNDSREDMYTFIVSLCTDLEDIYSSIDFLTDSDAGETVLSLYGENYLRNAIPGLQSMCPALFYIQEYVPEAIDVVPYDMSLGETYAQRLAGTEIERGATRLGEQFGVDGMAVFGFFIMAACIAICIVTYRKGWGFEPGALISAAIVTGAAILIGDLIFTLVMIFSLLAVMAIVYITIQKRA